MGPWSSMSQQCNSRGCKRSAAEYEVSAADTGPGGSRSHKTTKQQRLQQQLQQLHLQQAQDNDDVVIVGEKAGTGSLPNAIWLTFEEPSPQPSVKHAVVDLTVAASEGEDRPEAGPAPGAAKVRRRAQWQQQQQREREQRKQRPNQKQQWQLATNHKRQKQLDPEKGVPSAARSRAASRPSSSANRADPATASMLGMHSEPLAPNPAAAGEAAATTQPATSSPRSDNIIPEGTDPTTCQLELLGAQSQPLLHNAPLVSAAEAKQPAAISRTAASEAIACHLVVHSSPAAPPAGGQGGPADAATAANLSCNQLEWLQARQSNATPAAQVKQIAAECSTPGPQTAKQPGDRHQVINPHGGVNSQEANAAAEGQPGLVGLLHQHTAARADAAEAFGRPTSSAGAGSNTVRQLVAAATAASSGLAAAATQAAKTSTDIPQNGHSSPSGNSVPAGLLELLLMQKHSAPPVTAPLAGANAVRLSRDPGSCIGPSLKPLKHDREIRQAQQQERALNFPVCKASQRHYDRMRMQHEAAAAAAGAAVVSAVPCVVGHVGSCRGQLGMPLAQPASAPAAGAPADDDVAAPAAGINAVWPSRGPDSSTRYQGAGSASVSQDNELLAAGNNQIATASTATAQAHMQGQRQQDQAAKSNMAPQHRPSVFTSSSLHVLQAARGSVAERGQRQTCVTRKGSLQAPLIAPDTGTVMAQSASETGMTGVSQMQHMSCQQQQQQPPVSEEPSLGRLRQTPQQSMAAPRARADKLHKQRPEGQPPTCQAKQKQPQPMPSNSHSGRLLQSPTTHCSLSGICSRRCSTTAVAASGATAGADADAGAGVRPQLLVHDNPAATDTSAAAVGAQPDDGHTLPAMQVWTPIAGPAQVAPLKAAAAVMLRKPYAAASAVLLGIVFPTPATAEAAGPQAASNTTSKAAAIGQGDQAEHHQHPRPAAAATATATAGEEAAAPSAATHTVWPVLSATVDAASSSSTAADAVTGLQLLAMAADWQSNWAAVLQDTAPHANFSKAGQLPVVVSSGHTAAAATTSRGAAGRGTGFQGASPPTVLPPCAAAEQPDPDLFIAELLQLLRAFLWMDMQHMGVAARELAGVEAAAAAAGTRSHAAASTPLSADAACGLTVGPIYMASVEPNVHSAGGAAAPLPVAVNQDMPYSSSSGMIPDYGVLPATATTTSGGMAVNSGGESTPSMLRSPTAWPDASPGMDYCSGGHGMPEGKSGRATADASTYQCQQHHHHHQQQPQQLAMWQLKPVLHEAKLASALVTEDAPGAAVVDPPPLLEAAGARCTAAQRSADRVVGAVADLEAAAQHRWTLDSPGLSHSRALDALTGPVLDQEDGHVTSEAAAPAAHTPAAAPTTTAVSAPALPPPVVVPLWSVSQAFTAGGKQTASAQAAAHSGPVLGAAVTAPVRVDIQLNSADGIVSEWDPAESSSILPTDVVGSAAEARAEGDCMEVDSKPQCLAPANQQPQTLHDQQQQQGRQATGSAESQGWAAASSSGTAAWGSLQAPASGAVLCDSIGITPDLQAQHAGASDLSDAEPTVDLGRPASNAGAAQGFNLDSNLADCACSRSAGF